MKSAIRKKEILRLKMNKDLFVFSIGIILSAGVGIYTSSTPVFFFCLVAAGTGIILAKMLGIIFRRPKRQKDDNQRRDIKVL